MSARKMVQEKKGAVYCLITSNTLSSRRPTILWKTARLLWTPQMSRRSELGWLAPDDDDNDDVAAGNDDGRNDEHSQRHKCDVHLKYESTRESIRPNISPMSSEKYTERLNKLYTVICNLSSQCLSRETDINNYWTFWFCFYHFVVIFLSLQTVGSGFSSAECIVL